MDPKASIILSEEQKRFQWMVDGQIAYVAFERFPGGIAYLHTVVPEALRGGGIASQLVRHVLDYANASGLKVRPVCSFVNAYIDRHPEYQAISLFHGARPDPSNS